MEKVKRRKKSGSVKTFKAKLGHLQIAASEDL
jgi:hypothetical protein